MLEVIGLVLGTLYLVATYYTMVLVSFQTWIEQGHSWGLGSYITCIMSILLAPITIPICFVIGAINHGR